MKDVILLGTITLPPHVFFYTIILFDFIVFNLINIYNFVEMKFLVSNFQSLLFRYYFILMIFMNLVSLVHKLWRGTYNLFLEGTYSLLRLFSYVFLITNAVNLIHEYRSDQIESHTPKQKFFFTLIMVTLIVIYSISCRLSFDFHSMIDEYLEENSARKQRKRRVKMRKENESDETQTESEESQDSEEAKEPEKKEEDKKEVPETEVEGEAEADEANEDPSVVLIKNDPVEEIPLEKKIVGEGDSK